MTPRVLLTGCCGYIGSRIALDLLSAGFSVRGTSREPEYARQLFAEAFELHGLDHDARSRLEIVHGELLDARSFQGAAEGCSIVMHTACPVVTTVGVPRSEMIDPALVGTENVVRESARAGTVTRFIHMSSVVTLLDHHRPAPKRDASRLGPSDWNETASPNTDPYAFAKVRGERRARELVGELIPGARFASVLPGPVLGPPIAGARVPASVDKTLSPLLDGRLRAGSVDLWLAVVDVRDVSATFVELARLDDARFASLPDERRFICVSGPVPRMQELADAIRRSFPRYDRVLPKRTLPLPRVLLLGVMRLLLKREEYSYTSAMLGRSLVYDTSLAEQALGVRFRGASESIADTVAWLHARQLR